MRLGKSVNDLWEAEETCKNLEPGFCYTRKLVLTGIFLFVSLWLDRVENGRGSWKANYV